LDEKLFMVTIPPGIADGTTLRLKGMGARRDEAHRRGEVYLKIDVR
jgi:DnaJ-class molecular chaperone